MSKKLTSRQMLARMFRPRILAYGVMLTAITAAVLVSLATRAPFKVDVVRDRGALARTVGEGHVENVYRLQVMNATESVQHLTVQVTGLPGAAIGSKSALVLSPTEAKWVPVVVQLPYESVRTLKAGAHPIRFLIESRGPDGQSVEASVAEQSTFIVPR